MPALSKKDKLRLLKTILESRHADLREQNLNRQGKGHFHVSGMGHEALAAISILLGPDDYVVPYYRDRGLVLGRGMTTRELALEYFAKRNTGSGGRQMPSHYSDAAHHIWSVPTPTGSQLLPACGIAWGIQLDGKKNLVITTVGDAATRQGDFFEAICFAKEKKLPVLFVVEDNAYGISSYTRDTNPLALDALQPNDWRQIEGRDVQKIYDSAEEAIDKIRAGNGPVFFWIKMERLSSHTSSDDQKLYRSAEELRELEKCDPLKCWKDQLIAEGVLSAEEFAQIDNEIKERIRQEYRDAEEAEDPSPNELQVNVTASSPKLDDEILPPGKYRIGDTVNKTLRAGLEEDPRRIIFGEDVEDPKGGVFRLTQKLSTDFPKQVFNSPLAESTILGVACGLASYGKRPVFELQFIDFIYPGFNQLVTNISTLRWRSFGNWKCPAVFYAPYGAYLPGGSLWHSQANESVLAHYPGLSVVIPSTPEDAAGLLWTAMHGEDPIIFLIPKHLLWAAMISPPIFISKGNVVIGYNPIYEYAALPDVDRVVAAIRRSVATKSERAVVAAIGDRGGAKATEESAGPGSAIPATAKIDMSKQRAQSITVPIMGEGIRNAKIVSLLKKLGDPVALDDPLCEVETDKAVYPIESSFAGVMGGWKTRVGDTVEIGQELGAVLTGAPSREDQMQTAANASPDGKEKTVEAAVPAAERNDRGRHARRYSIEPARTPTIPRKLTRVIP